MNQKQQFKDERSLCLLFVKTSHFIILPDRYFYELNVCL